MSPVRLPRLTGRLVAGFIGFAAICALGMAVVVFGGSSERSSAAPGPVASFRAEGRLLRQMRAGGLGDAASVECAGPVRVGRATRCQVGYSNGDTQLILVDLDADGAIDVEIPYPAQRRPG